MKKIDLIKLRHTLLGRLVVILFLLFFAAPGTLAAEKDSRDPREFFFTQSFGDLPEELRTAREQGKQGLFLFFEAEGCTYCQRMLKRVFSQKDVQDWYRERFLSIAVDIHGDVEMKNFDGITLPSKVFAEQRGILMTPVLSFIDLSGVETYRHLGMVGSPEAFLLMGEYVADRHYLDTEFSAFAKDRGLRYSRGLRVTPINESSK